MINFKNSSLLLLLFSLFIPNWLYSQNIWVPTAPIGGIVKSLVLGKDGEIYAGTYGYGEYKSSDNGETWQQTALNNMFVWCQAVDSTGRIFVGTVGSGVFVSSDSGTSWSQVDWQPLTVDVRSIIVLKDGSKFIGTWGNGVFYMKNGDTTWVNCDTGITNLDVTSLCSAQSGKIYAGTSGGGLYISSDTGRTWKVDSTLSSSNINALTVDTRGYIWAATNDGLFNLANTDSSKWNLLGSHFILISVMVQDSDLVMAGMLGGNILCSKDGGLSWIQYTKSNNLPGEDIQSILTDPSNNNIFIASWGGGVYKTSDTGNSWNQVNLSCVNIESFLVDSSGTLLVGTDAAGIFRSTDNGLSWGQNSLINSYVYSIGATRSGKLLASANNGLYSSTDDGISWNNLGVDYWANLHYVWYWASDKSGKIFGATGVGIYVSSDDGDTWSGPVCPSSSSARGAITIDTTGTIYAGWDTLFVSSDDGMTWKSLWGNKIWIYSILSLSNGCILLGTADGIYRSTDYGSTWANTSPNVQNSIHFYTVTSLKMDSLGQIFAATYGGGVYESKDSGITWQEFNSGLPTLDIQSIGISTKGKTYAATQSAGVFVTENTTAVTQTTNAIPSRYRLYQNYPNPFNPTTVISYQLSAVSFVTIKVYDVLGREVETLVNEKKAPGNYQASFNGSRLASGIYFYRMQAGASTSSATFVETKKLILLK